MTRRQQLKRGLSALIEPGDLETAVGLTPEELGTTDPDNLHYVASRLRYFYCAMLGQRHLADAVFLDLGSGKGRVLYAAARRPFRRVLGIELSEELVVIARRNLARARPHLKCADVEVIGADAALYVVPDDVTHVYLYNPFIGDVFVAALGNLVASMDRARRPVRLMYANPVMHDAVLATGRFRVVRTWQDPRHRDDITLRVVVYEGR